MKQATVSVPGSSANLGPGFDVLGVALDLYLEARIAPAAAPRVRCSGPHGAGIALDESNLVLRAFRLAHERAGKQAPTVSLDLCNNIPLARGLGSSGAAAVAGVVLANHCGELGLTAGQMVALAAELEGQHADNVAASFYGGLVVACVGEEAIEVLPLAWPSEVGLVAAIPEFHLETSKARAVLPPSYTRADAVFNLKHLGLLIAALASGNPSAIGPALADRFHEPYRAPLVPGLKEAQQLRVPGLLGVVLSGAGPSLLAFTTGDSGPTVHALRSVYEHLHINCDVRPMHVALKGATINL